MAAPNLNFTLYPPIVDTYMPAFINTEACTIYFSLSSYNSLEDISGLQFTLKRQSNNITALKKKVGAGYENLSMVTLRQDQIQKTITETGEVQYSFQINPSLLGGSFEINTYYKVQIRFIDNFINANNLPKQDDSNIEVWNRNHLSNLSEWSTACLIKGILKPDIYLQNFDTERDIAVASGKETYLSAPQVLDIVGRMFFNDTQDKLEGENLKSYRVRIWEADNIKSGEELDDSGVIYVDQFSNENSINYSIKYNFTTGSSYALIIDCETNNLYKFSKKYLFRIKDSILSALQGTLSLKVDNEAGAVRLKFISKENYHGNMTIRRTSSESGFQVWEDVKTIVVNLAEGETLENSDLSDYTIKSGVFYKYAIQKRNLNGLRGDLTFATKTVIAEEDGILTEKEVEDIVMVVFDDLFLTRQNKQLRIQFDPSISSFGYKLSEAKTDTIGSQFPFIRRNGKIKYREFPIAGKITHISNIYNFLVDDVRLREDSCNTEEYGYFEEDTLLISKEEYYNSYKLKGKGDKINIADLYKEYDEANNITNYNNYIWERDFRDAAMDFLYDDTIKLFRTTTEGNILIKLTNISFTPNEELGRLIYNFSATATEIAKPEFDNYKKYGIIDSGNISSIVNNLEEEVISLTLDLKGTENKDELDVRPTNVIDAINEYLNREQISGEYVTYSIQELKWLRLQFYGPTHRISFEGGSPSIATKEPDIASAAPSTSALAYGYIATINGTNIFINKNGYYEIVDEKDLNITSLSFPTDEVITIECSVIPTKGDTEAPIEYVYNKLAQLDERFAPRQNFIQDIKDKYNILERNFEQHILSISTLDIEAPVGAVFYLQCEGMDAGEFNRHVIGKTGRLRLEDEGMNFTSGYYAGVILHKSDSTQVEEGEYVDSGKVLSSNKNKALLFKENQLFSIKGAEIYVVKVLNDVQQITNSLIVRPNKVIDSSGIGKSLIVNVSNIKNYISYNGANQPVLEEDISKETGDIQFYPQLDALITFKCTVTGKES